MTLFFHELKRGKLLLIIWTAALTSMLAITVLMFPLIKNIMPQMMESFAGLEDFGETFDYSSFSMYYGSEALSALGLGGALFAAMIGISSLSKEERDQTADFLLTHPLSRARIVAEKLLSVIVQIIVMNVVAIAVNSALTLAIGERPPFKEMFVMYAAFLILQIEIASISFGISSLLKKRGIGIGIGLVFFMYFLNIIGSLSEKVGFLNYVTPFSYAGFALPASLGIIDVPYLIPGIVLAVAGIVFAFLHYRRKDIA